MKEKELILKHSSRLVAYLFIVWGFYRFLFLLPEEIEALVLKPILWLLPIAYLLKKEKTGLSSLGFTLKKLFPSIYLSLGLGAVFALKAILINFVKYGGFEFTANIGEKSLLIALGLSFVTAISEEVVFRGYLFNRLWTALDNEWQANLISSIAWGIIHLPITVFVWNLGAVSILVFLLLTSIFGIGSAFIFARTKNITSSILLHVLWQWPIILFR